MATVNEYYERYWDAPETYYDPTTPRRQQLLRRHLATLPEGSRVLDLGCGRGEFCEFFRSLGFEAEGIDISSQVVAHARDAHHGIPFHVGEAASLLPVRAGAYDCVFSSEVIEHLFDVGEYLSAVNRLLKPGGLYVLTTPYHGLLKNVLIDALNYRGHYDPLGQHIRFFDRRGLADCLERFGFRPLVWTGYGRPWPFWKSFFVVSRKAADL
jgi:SAM-dependent methyltransferase